MKQPKGTIAVSAKFARQRSANQTMSFDPGLAAELVEALWRQPDQLVGTGEPLQVKDRGLVVRCEHATGDFLLKRSTWGGIGRTLRSLHRVSTARRCAEIGHTLLKEGIPTPWPRAFVEHGPGPLNYRSYLLTDFIPGESLFHSLRYNLIAEQDVPSIALQVAEIWERLIAMKFSHNDLKPENFIVDDSRRVWLIDVEKSRFLRDETKLQRKHLEDARIFLHIRNWRDTLPAAEIVRRELLGTTLGQWVADTAPEEHSTLRDGYSESDLACRISVALVNADTASLQASAKSVHDMADEVVVIEPEANNGQLKPCRDVPLPPSANTSKALPAISNAAPQHPWVLLLQPGEQATPDLVRELFELIADYPECEAIRIPVESIHNGRTVRERKRKGLPPIRAWHQARCSISLQDGEVTVNEELRHIMISPRKIQRIEGGSFHDLLATRSRCSAQPAQDSHGGPSYKRAA